jgi:hypothetical protein
MRVSSLLGPSGRGRLLVPLMSALCLSGVQVACQTGGFGAASGAWGDLLKMVGAAGFFTIGAGLALGFLLLVLCGMCCAQDGLN